MQDSWLFQLERPLDQAAADQLLEGVQRTLRRWKAHNIPVPSEAEMHHGQFLFVRAKQLPTGCSVDWMITAIHSEFQSRGLRLADNATVFFLMDDGRVLGMDFRVVPDAIRTGRLDPETILLDATVVQREGEWAIPLKDSWLQKYLPKAEV